MMTLWTVNWNQRKALELLLRSYVRHNYRGEKLRVVIVDNGSPDDSKEWLRKNGVPFVSLARNVFHERALNLTYNLVSTDKVLLCDSDIRIDSPVNWALDLLNDKIVSVGELISNERYHETVLMPRIAPWFHLFDIGRLKSLGVNAYRGENNDNWIYDVGSWLWEKIQGLGLENHFIQRTEQSAAGSKYDGHFFHFSQVSTDSDKFGVTYDVGLRRRMIEGQVKDYADVDISGVFDGPNLEWGNDFLDEQIAKGWVSL